MQPGPVFGNELLEGTVSRRRSEQGRLPLDILLGYGHSYDSQLPLVYGILTAELYQGLIRK